MAFIAGQTQACLVADVTINKQGQPILRRTYSGVATGKGYFPGMGSSAWQAGGEKKFDQAITQLLDQALPELTALLAHATQSSK
jgi:hypothetical protein